MSVTVKHGHLTMTRKKIVDVAMEQLAQSVKMNRHRLKHPREDQRGCRQPEG
jgi:hypothetical protein